MQQFISIEPSSAKYFHPWYGSEEFIHRKPRYCLWLGDCTPAELRQMPHCMKRIEAVHEMRKASPSPGTRKLAQTPTRFHVENMPSSDFIIIPRVSSERRRYVPMGFMSPDTLASDSTHIIPDATLYHFGVLESNVHMAWMRAVCGRLKSDYRIPRILSITTSLGQSLLISKEKRLSRPPRPFSTHAPCIPTAAWQTCTTS